MKERANYHRNEKIRERKEQRDNEKSYRELFMEDLNRIKKNAILTKKRHDQYCQLVSKVDESKALDGTELAKGSYQGSNFEMRRKADQNQHNYEEGRRRYSEAPTKNNFAEILRKKELEEVPEELPQPAIEVIAESKDEH